MTSAEGSSSVKALPRRAAAKKASRLAAEQLESSPPPGDEFEEATPRVGKTPRQRRPPETKSLRSKKSSVTVQSKNRTPKLDVRRTSPRGAAFTLSQPSFSDSDSDLENLGVLLLLVKMLIDIHLQKRHVVHSTPYFEASQVFVSRDRHCRVYRRTTWRPKPFNLTGTILPVQVYSQECEPVTFQIVSNILKEGYNNEARGFSHIHIQH